jgi:AbrB family looped-hinge helix DNA binding protein
MRRYNSTEPDVAVVSDKGQVVIPSYLRSKLDLKPRSKLLVYSVEDTIILKKLALPDMKKEMQQLWKEIDKKIVKYGEMTEGEIQSVIEKTRIQRRKRSKGA